MLQQSFDLLQGSEGPRVQSLPMAATPDAPAMVLHVLPVRRSARDIFSRGLAVVLATPVGPGGPPSIGVLSGLFDLTPGEARVARELASGAGIETVWKPFLWLAVIGAALFWLSLARFRKTLSSMA